MKSQTLHCTIAMPAEVRADCPRCDNAVSSERPNCPRCGLWMPWGDECVDQLAERLRDQWAAVRSEVQSQAPPLRTALRPAKPPRSSLALAAGGGAFAGALVVLGLQVLAPASTRPSALCKDGTVSFAKTRSGACASHDGVKQFFEGR